MKIIENADTEPNLIMEFVKHDSKYQFARDLKTLRQILREKKI